VGQKKFPNLFLLELHQICTKFGNFWHIDGQDNSVRYTHLPPHLIYVNTLPCKTQMLQIVTLRLDYQYQTVHLFIINLTEDAM